MTEKTCPIPEPFTAVIGSIVFLTLVFFLSFIGRFIFAPLMPAIGQDLGLTPTQAGSIFLIGSVGVLLGSVGSGFISSRINHRGSLAISLFTTGLALLACSIMPSLWMIRVSMWVLGVAAGINLPSNMATLTAIVSRPDWGKALAVQQIAPPMSLVLGPLLATAFLTWFSWTVPLAFIGVLAIAVGVVLLRLRDLGDFPGDPASPSLVKTILSRRSFWVMILLFALGMGCQVGIFAMMPLYLVKERGLTVDVANTLIGFSQVSALFMTFIAGWVSDRIGERRAIVLFLTSSGVATILLGVSSGAWLKVIVFLQAALIVCYFPAGFSALSRIVQPNLRSLTAAFATPTAFILGGGLFPAGLGYMGEVYTFGAGIVLAGCITILGSFLAFTLTLQEKMEEGC